MTKKVKIDYSVISRGTELYNGHGYIGISENVQNFKYVLNVDHGIKEAVIDNQVLKLPNTYDHYNIVFSRFQLITALMYNKNFTMLKDDVLILGLGNIGITCLFFLLDNNFKKITVFVREKKEYMEKLTILINKQYGININFIFDLEKSINFNTYIDTTGSSNVLENLFNNLNNNNTIVILSTPKDSTFLIDPLSINRKNLILIGQHELNGIDKNYREGIFFKLLQLNNNKNYLSNFINIYNYSPEKLLSIKKQKNNFIEIFKY